MQYRRTIHRIMDTYNQMTQVERTVADFFLNNTKPVDLASKNLAKLLYVSEGHPFPLCQEVRLQRIPGIQL